MTQHEQPRQQAELYDDCTRATEALRPYPTRVDAYLGCVHPPGEDWLRDTIDLAFVHAYRIEIENWDFPDEVEDIDWDEKGRAAGFWDELEERGAQEEK